MSLRLISHSADLQRLREEGYDIEIRANYLLVKHVPYVTSKREVAYGTLVSELSTSGTTTIRPNDHTAYFAGGIPCNNQGAELNKIIIGRDAVRITDDMTTACRFSSKPPEGYYPDYYVKMMAYVNMLSGWAEAIDSTVTAKTFPAIRTDEDEAVFRYLDTASSRAHISDITGKLALPKVAIVGLGGTGSFILDLIAKTPVQEIHLYDGDTLYAHNAFRMPGAASVEDLDARPTKVEYHRRRYDLLRRGIVAHPVYVDATNVTELQEMSFVFLAMDAGPDKKVIVDRLEEYGVPFVDCGIGVYRSGASLAGIVRVTASLPEHRDRARSRTPFDADGDNEYERNIQIADLNALNAVLAVIKWKKLFGFYADLEHELFTAYTIDGNHLLNEDQAS